MANELLDHFDNKSPKAYERFLEYLDGIPRFKRVLLILLYSFCSFAIVEYKDATPFNYPTAFSVWMGAALVASLISFLIKILLVLIRFVWGQLTIPEKNKIDTLQLTSLTLITSFLILIGLSIAAIFID